MLILWVMTTGHFNWVGLIVIHFGAVPAFNRIGVSVTRDPENVAEMVAQLTGLMNRQQLYLEPELTLARLAKKLHVPIKQLQHEVVFQPRIPARNG